jgi:hypothetical protein
MRHAQSTFTSRITRLLPAPLASLRLKQPLPVDLWSSRGTLLMSRGQVIESEDQLEKISGLHPLIQDAQYVELLFGSDNPEEVMAGAEPDPISGWPALHQRLHRLLREDLPSGEFENRLDILLAAARRMLAGQRDKSLFMLVQMLYDGDRAYSASHALMCFALCQLMAADAGLSEWDTDSICRAALTMNIGMCDLQDLLSRQMGQPDVTQRALIADHGAASARQLRSHGVKDRLWLWLLESHHDEAAATCAAFETDAVALRLLRMVDGYASRISPRRTRCGLAPNQAVRSLYVDMQSRAPALASLLVRALGIFPPGSYVRLHSGEIAVVVGRGLAAHQPRVCALIRQDGIQREFPTERDSRIWPHTVAESVVMAGHIVLRLDPSRLFPDG